MEEKTKFKNFQFFQNTTFHLEILFNFYSIFINKFKIILYLVFPI